jgi:uncharacterized protein (TIGR04222 family)
MYQLLSWILFGIGLAVLLPPAVSSEDALWPTEFGHLRRGGRTALLTALASLRKDRMVAFGRNGVRQTDQAPGSGDDPFRVAVYHALTVARARGRRATRPSVRAARAALAQRLVGYGLIAGRGRRWLGRALILASPVVALAGAVTGHTGWLGFGFAALVGAGGLWFSRRTVAGHLTVRSLRRGHNELMGGLTARDLDAVRPSTRGNYSATDYSSGHTGM